MVELFKTLGDLNRLRLLHLLTGNSLCVCELETLLGLTQSNVSRHLKRLRDAGCITASKEGQWIHYTLDGDFAGVNAELMRFLMGAFQRDAVYREDARKLGSYRKQGLSCNDIRSDKDRVVILIG